MDVHFCTPPGPIAWGMNPPMRRLSSTVMRGNRRRFSGTCAMPSATMRWDGVAKVDAFHLHAAAHPAVQSGDDAHQDGLAGAVGADHRDRLAGDLASLQADRAGANVPDNMSDRI